MLLVLHGLSYYFQLDVPEHDARDHCHQCLRHSRASPDFNLSLLDCNLQVWSLDNVSRDASDSAAATPQPTRSAKVFNAKHPESEVTTLAVHEARNGTLTIAAGLASGSVYVMQGEASAAAKLRHTAKLVARPDHSDLWCVHGLEFSGDTEGHAAGNERSCPMLFVVTESQTLTFNLSNGSKAILDAQGVRAAGCCMMRGCTLVVARDDAMYEYTTESRGGCSVFEGRKQMLAPLRPGRTVLLAAAGAGDAGQQRREQRRQKPYRLSALICKGFQNPDEHCSCQL